MEIKRFNQIYTPAGGVRHDIAREAEANGQDPIPYASRLAEDLSAKQFEARKPLTPPAVGNGCFIFGLFGKSS